MRRTALLTATILLGGCVTPSGIIDVTLPPQAEPITSQIEVKCSDLDPDARCIADAIAAGLAPRSERVRQKPNPRRPGPPAVMRR
ncbi:MAG TPA: hypothetical protein VNA69_17960 [Thermoanaerobaculia bacterium]|nr:hypothetical protein [Thermoanaerobaculia bacterium]